MFLVSSLPFFSAVALVVVAAIMTLGFKRSHQHHKGDEIAEFVQEGLHAFFTRVLGSIVQLVIYTSIVLFAFSVFFQKSFDWLQVVAFLVGGLAMGGAVYFSLHLAPRVIPKVVHESRGFLNQALKPLYTLSAVVALWIVGLLLTGLMSCYLFLGEETVIGFGLGVISAAFFLRIGGGIYRSATYVGASMIQRVESRVPQSDRRSPATVVQITGDYVQDVSGYSSDVLGSYVFAAIAALLFPAVLLDRGLISAQSADHLTIFPLVSIAISALVLLVILVLGWLRLKGKTLNNILLEGIYVAMIICALGAFFVDRSLSVQVSMTSLGSVMTQFHPFLPFIIGLVGAVLIGFSSEVLTTARFTPVKRLVQKVQFGSPIVLFSSLAMALKSNGIYLLLLLLIMLPSVLIAGFYGLALAALGMLCVIGPLVMAKAFSPMADNVNTSAMLTEDHAHTLKTTHKLVRIGYTTVPLGNALATAAAIVSTTALFLTLVLTAQADLNVLFLVDQYLLAGLIIGIILPHVFSGYLVQGLYRTTLSLFSEVARQFKEIPYLYEDQARPDVVKAVDTIARRALDALVIPGLLMSLTPIVAGFVFGEKVLVGLLFGVVLSAVGQSFYWGNYGDSVKEARHYMSSGHYGGPESPTYADMQVADAVGAAYRDVLGPSMNILIKSVAIIALLVMILI